MHKKQNLKYRNTVLNSCSQSGYWIIVLEATTVFSQVLPYIPNQWFSKCNGATHLAHIHCVFLSNYTVVSQVDSLTLAMGEGVFTPQKLTFNTNSHPPPNIGLVY
jgi:hypothetical protein